MSAEILELLQAYDWPGNVRELENYVERLALLSRVGPLEAQKLPKPGRVARLRRTSKQRAADAPSLIRQLVQVGIQTLPEGALKEQIVDAVERELIEQVMQECGGVGVSAAKKIGINRNTLHKKLDDYRKADGDAPSESAAE